MVTGAILVPHETQRRVVSGKTGLYASAVPGEHMRVIDHGGEIASSYPHCGKAEARTIRVCAAPIDTARFRAHKPSTRTRPKSLIPGHGEVISSRVPTTVPPWVPLIERTSGFVALAEMSSLSATDVLESFGKASRPPVFRCFFNSS